MLAHRTSFTRFRDDDDLSRQPAGARLDVLAPVHGRDGHVDAELAVDRPDVIAGPDHPLFGGSKTESRNSIRR